MIRDVIEIKWYRQKKSLKKENFFLVQKEIPFILPKKFIDLLKISDGGRVDYDFKYYDIGFKDIVGSGISTIYGAEKDPYECDLINGYYNPPEGFPRDLVSFAGNGGSNQICFDYRSNPKTDNPPVVYWNFGSEEGEDISPLADDFIEFLRMLREPEPIENYLKKD